jgi:DNA ligase (NAD+)
LSKLVTEEIFKSIAKLISSNFLSIIEFFAEEKNRTLMQRLKEAGLQLENMEVEKEKLSDIFSGKNIVISGVFSRFSRDEIKELVESHGGKNAGSISAKTSYVVAGENMGPAKLEKARQLNIPILDEEEFLKMIGE